MAAVNGFSHMELGQTERLHPMRRDQALQGASHSQEGSTSRLSTGCMCHVREPCPVPPTGPLPHLFRHPITSSTPDMAAPMPSFEGPNTFLPQDLCTCCFFFPKMLFPEICIFRSLHSFRIYSNVMAQKGLPGHPFTKLQSHSYPALFLVCFIPC